jgi:5-methylcytosine-specific restriction endonuclease McrA
MEKHHIEGTEFFSKKEAKARFRQHIFDFWGNKCAYCRESLGRSGTMDHVRPKSKGGVTRRSNLVACCYGCNMSKGSLSDWQEWYRVQDFWEPHLEDAIKLWLSQ